MIRFIFSIILLILLFGCKTNPPNSPDITNDYGSIIISSDVPGAQIFINEENSGKVTPDTLSLLVGEYIIKLQKTGYYCSADTVLIEKDQVKTINLILNKINIQKIVLLEDFSNTSCGPCVQSNIFIESLLHNTYPAHLLAIKYSTNFPGPNDPFYLANSEENDVRINYYNIFSAPTVFIDGILKPISTDSTAIKNAIASRLEIESPFELGLSTSIEQNTYKINISIMPVNLSSLDKDNLVVHAVITETEIHYDEPQPNGETDFFNVMRKMLPSCYGEELSGLVENEIKEYNYEYSLEGKTWVRNHLSVVVFIQDVTTKEVYQAVTDSQ